MQIVVITIVLYRLLLNIKGHGKYIIIATPVVVEVMISKPVYVSG